ncbi:thiol:disulfide interchange protein DsbG [Bordetella sp. FB-8]|uniref:thiol:disulfide interchange protein DsbG n=1 Tax=Bordetella sp. FB-8 TaxID=1159870 RepID=UPI00037AD2A6|nr:thiol:disulfide interchange protein DsbG [Bordetella sp. FB-8]
MNSRLRRGSSLIALTAGLLAAALNLARALPAHADGLPPILNTLKSQGVSVIAPLPAPPNMSGWAARVGGRPVALYVTQDGKYVVAGTLLDQDGRDLTHHALLTATDGAISPTFWQALDHANWIADGKAQAPRIVYVFTDPNCPYCSKFWADARPWVQAGKVQLRHVIVGILTPSSPGKAATILNAADPAQALRDYEARQTAHVDQEMAQGHPRALEDPGLKPLDPIPAPIKAKLNANLVLMQALSMQATPGFVWRDAKGLVHARTGMPASLMQDVMGPKPDSADAAATKD